MKLLRVHLMSRMLGSVFQGEPSCKYTAGSVEKVNPKDYKYRDFILKNICGNHILGHPVGQPDETYRFNLENVWFYRFDNDDEVPCQPFLEKLFYTLDYLEDDIESGYLSELFDD